jgi:predicted transcriptional regulator
MKIEITRECALIAIAAYLAGLMIGDFIEGVLAFLFIILILWAVKDCVEKLSNKSKENHGGSSDPASQGPSNPSEGISILLKSLKDGERRIVECLHEYGEMTQTELAAKTSIPKSTLSRTLRSLEDREIIERYSNGMSKMVRLKIGKL